MKNENRYHEAILTEQYANGNLSKEEFEQSISKMI